MSELFKSRMHMFGVWCGIGYIVVLTLGWGVVAGFLPPSSPTMTATEVAKLFQEDHVRIGAGMVILMVGALVLLPFCGVVAHYIAKVEGGVGMLTMTFLLGAAGTMALTFYPAIFWLTAAFRPERAGEISQIMNDMAWLQLIGGVTVYLAMPFSIAIAALADQRADPVFPRWCGYACAALGVGIVPDQLLFFFKTGPFAWNGLLSFWMPLSLFGGFFVVVVVVMRKRVLHDRRQLRVAEAPSPAIGTVATS